MLLSDIHNDEQDLENMRRVARRLAARGEVPDDDEVWASMGVNLRLHSSNAPRHQRRLHHERVLERVRGARVERSARVERGNARL